jgi:hypothetical protein
LERRVKRHWRHIEMGRGESVLDGTTLCKVFIVAGRERILWVSSWEEFA